QRIDPPVARQDVLEDQIKLTRADPRSRDVPDVDPPDAEAAAGRLRREHALHDAGPARVLIEGEAFGGAAAGHEDAEQSVAIGANLPAALAVGVDLEPHARLDARERVRLLAQLQSHARQPDVVARVA